MYSILGSTDWLNSPLLTNSNFCFQTYQVAKLNEKLGEHIADRSTQHNVNPSVVPVLLTPN